MTAKHGFDLPAELRVLVADDLPLNCKLLCRAFRTAMGSNWHVEYVQSAEGAVAMSTAGTSYDIILMDEHFSDDKRAMRGSEAIRAIRQHEARHALEDGDASSVGRALIISCTSDAYEPQIAHDILCSGADALWGKPFPDFTNGAMQTEVRSLLQLAGSRRCLRAQEDAAPVDTGAWSLSSSNMTTRFLARALPA